MSQVTSYKLHLCNLHFYISTYLIQNKSLTSLTYLTSLASLTSLFIFVHLFRYVPSLNIVLHLSTIWHVSTSLYMFFTYSEYSLCLYLVHCFYICFRTVRLRLVFTCFTSLYFWFLKMFNIFFSCSTLVLMSFSKTSFYSITSFKKKFFHIFTSFCQNTCCYHLRASNKCGFFNILFSS